MQGGDSRERGDRGTQDKGWMGMEQDTGYNSNWKLMFILVSASVTEAEQCTPGTALCTLK